MRITIVEKELSRNIITINLAEMQIELQLIYPTLAQTG